MIEFKPLPFDPTQKLFLLKADADPRAALHPEQFRQARRERERQNDGNPAAPDLGLWEELPRDELIAGRTAAGRSLHRLAITTDAGLGKTYNLVWQRYEFSDAARKQPAFVIPIGDLRRGESFTIAGLVQNFIIAAGYSEAERPALEWCLERQRRRGELILLFDGLDMAGDDSIQVLADILSPDSQWRDCRIEVAGRPFALERHWTKLFHDPVWTFAQIAEFDKAQQHRALGMLADGGYRYEKIPDEARRILTVPRVLEMLRALPEQELATLQTVSDVYWRACKYMLLKALGPGHNPVARDRYLAILGALAFSMYARVEKDEHGALQPNLDRIHATDMTSFLLGEVLPRLETTDLRVTEQPFFQEQIPTVSRLNALVNHGWFDNDNVGRSEDLLWRNASLQEFLAAFWVTRWGKEDSALLEEWVVDPLTYSNRGFYWFWRCAVEMPEEAISPGLNKPPEAWIASMEPLYNYIRAPVRSTEFIYRAWNRMKAWGPSTLSEFLAEFPRLAKNGTPEQQPICAEITGGFQAIPAGICHYGADQVENLPGKPIQVDAFRMHQWPVTNEMYELFDADRKDFRWGDLFTPGTKRHPLPGADGHGDDRCPVVFVSWYDAWAFSVWCGFRLPTEQEWEHACRCGSATRYYFGNDERDLANHAWFADNSKRYTHPVPEEESLKHRNGNKLYDMHGNVWEWCDSHYEPGASARVLRGGGWFSLGGLCRSAFRDWYGPDNRDSVVGFRLAAVPADGAKQDKRSVGDEAASVVERSVTEPRRSRRSGAGRQGGQRSRA